MSEAMDFVKAMRRRKRGQSFSPQDVYALCAFLDEHNKALVLAYAAMNYLGNKLNALDMVEDKDNEATDEAFEVIRKMLDTQPPAS